MEKTRHVGALAPGELTVLLSEWRAGDPVAFDLRKGRIFELRHFGGLSVDEAAEVLKVSPATVARDWRMAKAWLRRAIASESERAG